MGNIINKYRVHEVAKDFGLPTKTIVEVLTKYATAPKNHMQVLDDQELSLIFEYLTQHNQVSGMDVIFSEVYQQEKAEHQQSQKPKVSGAPQQRKDNRPQHQGTQQPRPQQNMQPAQLVQNEQQPVNKPSTRVPEKKVVDTRKAANVNLEKYDERLEDIADSRTRGAHNMQQGKEKFRNAASRKKNQPAFSNKRKQEEQENMRRLQLVIAKKTPLKVMIPDEISVGELASRMK